MAIAMLAVTLGGAGVASADSNSNVETSVTTAQQVIIENNNTSQETQIKEPTADVTQVAESATLSQTSQNPSATTNNIKVDNKVSATPAPSPVQPRNTQEEKKTGWVKEDQGWTYYS